MIDEADRMMEEIKQDWLSLVDKAVYREHSATDGQVYLNPCERLAPGPMTLEKYERVISVNAVMLSLNTFCKFCDLAVTVNYYFNHNSIEGLVTGCRVC